MTSLAAKWGEFCFGQLAVEREGRRGDDRCEGISAISTIQLPCVPKNCSLILHRGFKCKGKDNLNTNTRFIVIWGKYVENGSNRAEGRVENRPSGWNFIKVQIRIGNRARSGVQN